MTTEERDKRREGLRSRLPGHLKPQGLKLGAPSLAGRVEARSSVDLGVLEDRTNSLSPVLPSIKPVSKRPSPELPSLFPTLKKPPAERVEMEPKFKVDIPAASDSTWVERTLRLCQAGYEREENIEATDLGTSGSYFVSDLEGKKIAILKPLDEELGAQRARRSDILMAKEGIRPGTCGFREVVSAKLFPDLIPPTALVTTSYRYFHYRPDLEGVQPVKQCSMQKIIPDVEEAHTITEHEIPSLLPHLPSIAMIDICLANSDRHAGNLMIKRDEKGVSEVFPIDHGCILPDNFGTGGLFFWYSLVDPSVRFSTTEQDRIRSIDLTTSRDELRIIPEASGAVNTCVTSVTLAKKLCETTSIKEIATYQIDDPDGIKGYKSLCCCMLKMAALLQNRLIDVREEILFEVDQTLIERVIVDVTSFIEEKKSSEGDLSVHLRVREVLNKLINTGKAEELLSGSWKSEI
jgi:hypothetical protein